MIQFANSLFAHDTLGKFNECGTRTRDVVAEVFPITDRKLSAIVQDRVFELSFLVQIRWQSLWS